jgi:hypothetical protein
MGIMPIMPGIPPAVFIGIAIIPVIPRSVVIVVIGFPVVGLCEPFLKRRPRRPPHLRSHLIRCRNDPVGNP